MQPTIAKPARKRASTKQKLHFPLVKSLLYSNHEAKMRLANAAGAGAKLTKAG